MMNYVMITLQVLLVELAGVAAMAGILYVYWNVLTNR